MSEVSETVVLGVSLLALGFKIGLLIRAAVKRKEQLELLSADMELLSADMEMLKRKLAGLDR